MSEKNGRYSTLNTEAGLPRCLVWSSKALDQWFEGQGSWYGHSRKQQEADCAVLSFPISGGRLNYVAHSRCEKSCWSLAKKRLCIM